MEILNSYTAMLDSGMCELSLVGFYDDNPCFKDSYEGSLPYLGSLESYLSTCDHEINYIVASGASNQLRMKLSRKCTDAGKSPITIVDPTAKICSSAKIGSGTYIGTGAFIGPRSIIGCHNIVNVHSSIGHDSVLGDWVQVCPGARVSGNAEIGEGVFLGSNSVAGPKISIGPWARLAACSFAARDIPRESVAVGIPAKATHI